MDIYTNGTVVCVLKYLKSDNTGNLDILHNLYVVSSTGYATLQVILLFIQYLNKPHWSDMPVAFTVSLNYKKMDIVLLVLS